MPTRRVSLLALTLILVLVQTKPASSVRASEVSTTAAEEFSGRSLTEALLRLNQLGLKIVFSSNVVLPDMAVNSEPSGKGLRHVLAQLLAPHGLQTVAGPGRTLVVVPNTSTPTALATSITGFVKSRGDLTPRADVSLRLLGADQQVLSAHDGSFAFFDLESGTYSLEVRQRGFVVEQLDGIEVSTGTPAHISILLDPAPITEEELAVTPSRVSLLRQGPVAPLALSRDDLLSLPHLGDDFFRALSLLPGVAANDVSASFHVRGSRRDETKILVDGQELFETYHLKDFDSALSVIAPAALESVDLSTGGFAAQHGDRMSGVLDMMTVTPTGPVTAQLGLGIFNVHAGASGAFAKSRGSWIAQTRRGSNDFAGKVVGPENPRFWDALGKLDYQLNPQNSLRLNLLQADDELEFVEIGPDGEKRFETDYQSAYYWLTHQRLVGPKLFFDSAISSSSVNRARFGFEADEDVQFDVSDRRKLYVLAVRQNWNWQPNSKHFLKTGFELRQFDTSYDYDGLFDFDVPLAEIRANSSEGQITFRNRFKEDHNSFYLSDRLRPTRDLTLELGLRFDSHTQTNESHLKPRLNLAWGAGLGSVVRVAWGRFNQSQRPYELQVEDGETGFHKVERSEHRVLGYERLFDREGARPLALRIELYERRVLNPRPRFENLYEPVNEFQEVEPDRVRIAPDRSFAEGLEVFLRGPAGSKASWWLTYALSSTEDEVAGKRLRRSFDQTHSLNLDFDYRINPFWKLNLAWRYHTGWPTTPLSVRPVELTDENGEVATEFEPVLGPRFSDRLPDYHRMDARASRRWQLGRSVLTFFVDIQNLYNRRNAAGFDFDIDEETGVVDPNIEEWTGFLPSAGFSFEF